jgi:hypothetical protein
MEINKLDVVSFSSFKDLLDFYCRDVMSIGKMYIAPKPYIFFFLSLTAGLPDFSWHNIPKRGKYQISTKCAKWP